MRDELRYDRCNFCSAEIDIDDWNNHGIVKGIGRVCADCLEGDSMKTEHANEEIDLMATDEETEVYERDITIETDLSVEFRDAGKWRSYHLSTYGATLIDLMANADIEEIDQDGGTLATYPMADASHEVFDDAVNTIRLTANRKGIS